MAKKKTIAKDIPLAEITLRRYEKPNNLTEKLFSSNLQKIAYRNNLNFSKFLQFL